MIVQTHWSKPYRWRKQNQSLADLLYMYAASAYSIKKSFNSPIAMITDSSMASILTDLPMPYDFISNELDEWNVDPQWWASPKFYVFQKYAQQFHPLIQMDTDIFFWEPMGVKSHVQLLVQSIETGEQFENSYEVPVAFVDKALRKNNPTAASLLPWRPDLRTALNCGVVGFAEPAYAMEYAAMALDICENLTPYLNEFQETIPRKKRAGSIMVVPEQYFLGCYAAAKDMYIAYISTKFSKGGQIVNYNPTDYYHAMASKKDPTIRLSFKELVRTEQPKLFAAIQKTAYAGL
jgi:hypothetical protein